LEPPDLPLSVPLPSCWLGAPVNIQGQLPQASALTRHLILPLRWLEAIISIQEQSYQPSALTRRVLLTLRWLIALFNILSTGTINSTKCLNWPLTFNLALAWSTCQYTTYREMTSNKCVTRRALLTSRWLGAFFRTQGKQRLKKVHWLGAYF
jgi:hypothetical protein